MLISIVICTYNRGLSLKRTLDSFFKQEDLSLIQYELLLIDNNSKDHTKELIGEYITQYGNAVKYFLEPNQGVSFAKNKGIEESRGDVIAFTDDDVVIEKGWLINLIGTFKQYKADAVGGRIIPVYPDGTPEWIKENKDILAGPVVAYDRGESIISYQTIKPVTEPVGANMAFKRELFIKFGSFRTDIGPGTGTIVGEDTEFCTRFIKDPNVNTLYCGKAIIFHPVEKSRMTLKYYLKWKFASGRSEAIASRLHNKIFPMVFWCPRFLVRKFLEDFIFLLFTSFNRRRFLKYSLSLSCNLGAIFQFTKERFSF